MRAVFCLFIFQFQISCGGWSTGNSQLLLENAPKYTNYMFYCGDNGYGKIFSRKNKTFKDLHYCNTKRKTVSVTLNNFFLVSLVVFKMDKVFINRVVVAWPTNRTFPIYCLKVSCTHRIPCRNAWPGSRTCQPDQLSEYRVTIVSKHLRHRC